MKRLLKSVHIVANNKQVVGWRKRLKDHVYVRIIVKPSFKVLELLYKGKHLDPMIMHRRSFGHLGPEECFFRGISNMPVRNRINIFHAEHYRGNILKPIILLLNLVGHRSQYDTADLAVVLMSFLERETFFKRGPLRQGHGEWLVQDIPLVFKI
ncbi:UNVERIFIED_CONTAM: hypothetical protein Sradi_7019500 [Sesamum radiatum]|uniref:Uncharacterized protein n=1 Tax=Sesamum radiatum TaxID=300843 RepID=A0AAW2JBS2_SESRA